MQSLIAKTQHLKKDLTATGYVVNHQRTKLLVVFHNKLQKWLPAGGHIEPNELPHEAAKREVFEETGVKARIITDEHDMGIASDGECLIPRPYSMLYQLIPANTKDAEHIHVDFIYAMEAEESELTIQIKEVSKAAWLTKPEVLASNTFDSVKGFVRTMLKAA